MKGELRPNAKGKDKMANVYFLKKNVLYTYMG